MPEYDEPEKVWDEYDWERFLQQQDLKAERYMELLEQYSDDPDRDRIIAQEMGWQHLTEEEEGEPEWARGLTEDAFEDSAEEEAEEEMEAEESASQGESFELHPLYQASFGLTIWLDQWFEELGEAQNSPASVKLATNSAIASAKLAAALSDEEGDEIGMTIAYLKRALKAMTLAIEASVQLAQENEISSQRRSQLHARLFQVRDGIIELMGEYRREWRRRYES
jgi:hypothetical protein